MHPPRLLHRDATQRPGLCLYTRSTHETAASRKSEMHRRAGTYDNQRGEGPCDSREDINEAVPRRRFNDFIYIPFR